MKLSVKEKKYEQVDKDDNNTFERWKVKLQNVEKDIKVSMILPYEPNYTAGDVLELSGIEKQKKVEAVA